MDWSDAYDNRANTPNFEGMPERWAADAAAFRAALGSQAETHAYGSAEREKLDLFRPEGESRGLAIFVHGGYWRSFGRQDWSHLAAGALARGWTVALPGYTLTPEIAVPGITRQVTRAIETVAGMVPGPIRISGHSAGGHLASRMACPDTLSPETRGRIERITSISGVHDLRPILRTAQNGIIRLTEAEAVAESPALLTPAEGLRVMAWVGGDERPEFIRQTHLLANIWTGCAVGTAAHVEPGQNHFTVVDPMVAPDSPLTEAWIAG